MNLRPLTTLTVVRRLQTLGNALCLIKSVCVHLVEIYFSIVQRKVLTPNDFASLAALEHHLLAFQHRYQTMARPFQWTFTRADLRRLLAKLPAVRPAA